MGRKPVAPLASSRAGDWELRAFKYYYIAPGEVGVAGIVIEPTADLLALQQMLLGAVAPFVVEIGTVTAFATTPEEPDIVPGLIDYIAAFVPNSMGEHFNLHVTIGIATREYEEFSFSPVGAAVYQLGDFGTATDKAEDLGLAVLRSSPQP